MATDTATRSSRLDPAIASLLGRLRRRIRAYVWADGVAAVLVAVGASFWCSLVLDWTFEPPVGLRIFLLLLAAGIAGYVAWRFLLGRLAVRLADHSMAVLLERRYGAFRDSLLTAVELSERPDHAEEFNTAMLAHTRRDALAKMSTVDLRQVFNAAPLAQRISLALALIVSIVVFSVAAPAAMGVWLRRNVMLSDELWPRDTHLQVEGFDAEGHIKIARGSDWQLAVKADAALGRAIPEIVEVRYATGDGARGRENMSRDGVVLPGQAAFQNYTYTFKGVLAPVEFTVRGGDDRQGPYHLDVVDSPTISEMTLHCEYPAYMKREPRDVSVAGLMQVPRGTQITLSAKANKPLVAVEIHDVADPNAPQSTRLELAAEKGQPQSSFQYNLKRLDSDKTLLFILHDADGIRSRDAVRLTLGAVPDEVPQVSVQLKGIGTAITPGARLPAVGEVSDDYGLSKLWFDFHVDDAPAQQRPLEAAPGGREKLAVTDSLELGELELQPKQKLHWAVQAADNFALEGGPNVGTSTRYVLDVVTPEQLRAMLEARELVLRRRFEVIIGEFTETRDLLTSLVPAAEKSDEGKPAAAEPGDADKAGKAVAAPVVQVERVAQNSQRSAHETQQVALAFDDIREEMINNRVDTEELKVRLKDGVADPLKRIVTESFPKLDERLKKLAAQLSDAKAAPAAQAAALEQADVILVEMKQVLDKMLELETFNEVLDMLRQIIGSQEKINAETKQKQKDKLRDLTE